MAGEKESFCPLLWKATGGEIDAKGNPALPAHVVRDLELGIPVTGIRGLCTRPYDCAQCDVMHWALSTVPERERHWVCPACLSGVIRYLRSSGASYSLPGHYTEGYCGWLYCQRPELELGGEVQPAKYSRFLQLIIGPING